jgi:hypothetical protein
LPGLFVHFVWEHLNSIRHEFRQGDGANAPRGEIFFHKQPDIIDAIVLAVRCHLTAFTAELLKYSM